MDALRVVRVVQQDDAIVTGEDRRAAELLVAVVGEEGPGVHPLTAARAARRVDLAGGERALVERGGQRAVRVVVAHETDRDLAELDRGIPAVVQLEPLVLVLLALDILRDAQAGCPAARGVVPHELQQLAERGGVDPRHHVQLLDGVEGVVVRGARQSVGTVTMLDDVLRRPDVEGDVDVEDLEVGRAGQGQHRLDLGRARPVEAVRLATEHDRVVASVGRPRDLRIHGASAEHARGPDETASPHHWAPPMQFSGAAARQGSREVPPSVGCCGRLAS